MTPFLQSAHVIVIDYTIEFFPTHRLSITDDHVGDSKAKVSFFLVRFLLLLLLILLERFKTFNFVFHLMTCAWIAHPSVSDV